MPPETSNTSPAKVRMGQLVTSPPRFPEVVPQDIAIWGLACLSDTPPKDEEAMNIESAGGANTLKELLSDAEVAQGLAGYYSKLQNVTPVEALLTIQRLLSKATVAKWLTKNRTFLAPRDEAKELEAVAVAVRKNAQQIRLMRGFAPDADSAQYLLDQVITEATTPLQYEGPEISVLRRSPNPLLMYPTLPSLMDCYAATLEKIAEHLTQMSKKRKRHRVAGKYAIRNFMIDYLLGFSSTACHPVPHALIARMIKTLTGTPVAESVIRSRS